MYIIERFTLCHSSSVRLREVFHEYALRIPFPGGADYYSKAGYRAHNESVYFRIVVFYLGVWDGNLLRLRCDEGGGGVRAIKQLARGGWKREGCNVENV